MLQDFFLAMDRCAICLENFDPAKVDEFSLTCGHVFHDQCIQALANGEPLMSVRCPTCKRTGDENALAEMGLSANQEDASIMDFANEELAVDMESLLSPVPKTPPAVSPPVRSPEAQVAISSGSDDVSSNSSASDDVAVIGAKAKSAMMAPPPPQPKSTSFPLQLTPLMTSSQIAVPIGSGAIVSNVDGTMVPDTVLCCRCKLVVPRCDVGKTLSGDRICCKRCLRVEVVITRKVTSVQWLRDMQEGLVVSFYQQAHNMSPAQIANLAASITMSASENHQTVEAEGGKFLPLSVYESKGYHHLQHIRVVSHRANYWLHNSYYLQTK